VPPPRPSIGTQYDPRRASLHAAGHFFGVAPYWKMRGITFQNRIDWRDLRKRGEFDMRYIALWLLGVPVMGIVVMKLFGII
jgi:hypothetical protein